MTAELIVNKGQLIEYFAAGASPREEWKIGLECEFFVVQSHTLKSISYWGEQGVVGVLEELAKSFGWEPQLEDGALLSLKRGSARVTLEPGGQMELSGSPFTFIEDSIKERETFIAELKEVAARKGLAILVAGYQPVSTLENTQWIPKKRYKYMREYFLKHGGYLAHHMMKLTTTVQLNIDYADEEDFGQKMLLAHYLTPIFQAIYANSPFKQGTYSGFLDFRGYVWEHTDSKRSNLLPRALEKAYTYEDYVDYLLNVPMILRYEGEKVIPMEGMPFKEYWSLGNATMADWENHNSFVFPEVRLKSYLELRMCDSVKSEMTATFPALVKGVFYHHESRQKLLGYFQEYSPQELEKLYHEVHKKALEATIQGRPVLEVARDVVNVAEEGLKSLAQEGLLAKSSELKYLEPLKEQLWEKGYPPAQELLNSWEANYRRLDKIKDMLFL